MSDKSVVPKAIPTLATPRVRDRLDGAPIQEWDDAGVLRLVGAVLGERWLRENIYGLLNGGLSAVVRRGYARAYEDGHAGV